MPFKAKGPTEVTDWANASDFLPYPANGDIFPVLELCLLALSLHVAQCVALLMYKTVQKRRDLSKQRLNLKKEAVPIQSREEV